MTGVESILFFGTPCGFANKVMSRLVDQGYTVAAQIIPGDPNAPRPLHAQRQASNIGTGNRLPMATGGSRESVPLGPYGRIQINDHRHESVVRTLAEIEADLAVVCCYPRKIPLELIRAARLGGVNVHPSLLPDYRGPDPLFWVFRNGETRTGVSVHTVDGTLDSGPLLAQRAIEVPVGARGDAIWSESASVGADLLLESIQALETGRAQEVSQDESAARYYTWPTGSDLVIVPEEWDAWRVFHFCRGVVPLGHTPMIARGTVLRRVLSAERYVESNVEREHSGPDTEWIACRRGSVEVRMGPAFW